MQHDEFRHASRVSYSSLHCRSNPPLTPEARAAFAVVEAVIVWSSVRSGLLFLSEDAKDTVHGRVALPLFRLLRLVAY